MFPFTSGVFGKIPEERCPVKLLRSWLSIDSEVEWIMSEFSILGKLSLKPSGCWSPVNREGCCGEDGDKLGMQRGSRAYLAGYMTRTQAYTGGKGGKGNPPSPGARTKGHQYLPGLRPWPAAGQTERWCPSPRQPCPPGPADGPGISRKVTRKECSPLILWC